MKTKRFSAKPKQARAARRGERFSRALIALVLSAGVDASDRARSQDSDKDDARVHVVLLSIDGLRPDFYLEDSFETPNLRALVARGASARAVEPAFPSCTYPGHASIVTGDRPARHGIVSNTLFGDHGDLPEWRWNASELRAKPIWQAAHEQGKKVAITNWPTTVDAKVDWLVPERWAVHGESTRDLLLKFSTPGLLIELGLALGVPNLEATKATDRSKIDEFIAGAAAHLLTTKRPSLVLAHLIQVDEVEHARGRDAQEVKDAVKRVDACVGIVAKAVKEAGMESSTVIAIVGDHGFTDATTCVSPNVLLAREGLIELEAGAVKSFQAFGQAFGGSLAVHAKTPAAARKAREILEREAVVQGKRLYSIVSKEQADALGADPAVAFYLDAGEGVALRGPTAGDFVSEIALHGVHGGLSTKPQLATGFMAAGPGVRHTELAHMRLIDVAPTLARLLHIDLPDTDGGVVPVLEQEPD